MLLTLHKKKYIIIKEHKVINKLPLPVIYLLEFVIIHKSYLHKSNYLCTCISELSFLFHILYINRVHSITKWVITTKPKVSYNLVRMVMKCCGVKLSKLFNFFWHFWYLIQIKQQNCNLFLLLSSNACWVPVRRVLWVPVKLQKH